MNNINFNSEAFMQTKEYQEFIKKNNSFGYLNIRAYAANSAIPINGLRVVVSKIINNQRIIFFDGSTNDSGMISSIALPSPSIESNNTVVPNSETYDIVANYNNEDLIFKITIFSNIQVLQNINVVPSVRLDVSYYGS